MICSDENREQALNRIHKEIKEDANRKILNKNNNNKSKLLNRKAMKVEKYVHSK